MSCFRQTTTLLLFATLLPQTPVRAALGSHSLKNKPHAAEADIALVEEGLEILKKAPSFIHRGEDLMRKKEAELEFSNFLGRNKRITRSLFLEIIEKRLAEVPHFHFEDDTTFPGLELFLLGLEDSQDIEKYLPDSIKKHALFKKGNSANNEISKFHNGFGRYDSYFWPNIMMHLIRNDRADLIPVAFFEKHANHIALNWPNSHIGDFATLRALLIAAKNGVPGAQKAADNVVDLLVQNRSSMLGHLVNSNNAPNVNVERLIAMHKSSNRGDRSYARTFVYELSEYGNREMQDYFLEHTLQTEGAVDALLRASENKRIDQVEKILEDSQGALQLSPEQSGREVIHALGMVLDLADQGNAAARVFIGKITEQDPINTIYIDLLEAMIRRDPKFVMPDEAFDKVFASDLGRHEKMNFILLFMNFAGSMETFLSGVQNFKRHFTVENAELLPLMFQTIGLAEHLSIDEIAVAQRAFNKKLDSKAQVEFVDDILNPIGGREHAAYMASLQKLFEGMNFNNVEDVVLVESIQEIEGFNFDNVEYSLEDKLDRIASKQRLTSDTAPTERYQQLLVLQALSKFNEEKAVKHLEPLARGFEQMDLESLAKLTSDLKQSRLLHLMPLEPLRQRLEESAAAGLPSVNVILSNYRSSGHDDYAFTDVVKIQEELSNEDSLYSPLELIRFAGEAGKIASISFDALRSDPHLFNSAALAAAEYGHPDARQILLSVRDDMSAALYGDYYAALAKVGAEDAFPWGRLESEVDLSTAVDALDALLHKGVKHEVIDGKIRELASDPRNFLEEYNHLDFLLEDYGAVELTPTKDLMAEIRLESNEEPFRFYESDDDLATWERALRSNVLFAESQQEGEASTKYVQALVDSFSIMKDMDGITLLIAELAEVGKANRIPLEQVREKMRFLGSFEGEDVIEYLEDAATTEGGEEIRTFLGLQRKRLAKGEIDYWWQD